MGVQLDTSIKSIRNTWGHEQVDMGLVKDGSPIALGFKELKNADGSTTLELRGDFYGTGLNESQFMDKLSQEYTKYDITDKIANKTSYTIDSVTMNKKGEYEIVAYSFA